MVCWWPTPEPVAYLVGVRGVGKISVTLSRPPVGVLGARGRAPAPEPVACLVGVPCACRVPVCHQIERPARWCAGGPPAHAVPRPLVAALKI